MKYPTWRLSSRPLLSAMHIIHFHSILFKAKQTLHTLTDLIRMKFPILINRTRPFPVLGLRVKKSINPFKPNWMSHSYMYQLDQSISVMVLKYTPQNNWRTNTINYNIDAFCVERILKTNFTIESNFFGHLWRLIAKCNSKKKLVKNVTNKGFCVILKLGLNVVECHFLCVAHGPQNCMKLTKSAFICWNLYFCMILLRFNPVDTIHLFLWKKIAPFGCGVKARLWIQTTGFGVCTWQSLNDSSGHLSNTRRHRITIENLILDGQEHILFSENKTMSQLHCQRWKCLLPGILKLFKEHFCM